MHFQILIKFCNLTFIYWLTLKNVFPKSIFSSFPQTEQEKWENVFPTCTSLEEIDLVDKLIIYNPSNRLSANQVIYNLINFPNYSCFISISIIRHFHTTIFPYIIHWHLRRHQLRKATFVRLHNNANVSTTRFNALVGSKLGFYTHLMCAMEIFIIHTHIMYTYTYIHIL